MSLHNPHLLQKGNHHPRRVRFVWVLFPSTYPAGYRNRQHDQLSLQKQLYAQHVRSRNQKTWVISCDDRHPFSRSMDTEPQQNLSKCQKNQKRIPLKEHILMVLKNSEDQFCATPTRNTTSSPQCHHGSSGPSSA